MEKSPPSAAQELPGRRLSRRTLLTEYLPAAAAGLTLMTGCSRIPSLTGPGVNKLRPVEVPIGLIGSVSDAGIFIAHEEGYFEEQGIKPLFHEVGVSSDLVSQMANGTLQVGAGGITAALMNGSTEHEFKVVADKGTNSKGHGYEAIVVGKQHWDNGSIRSVSDLRGETVAIFGGLTGSATEAAFYNALKAKNMTYEDVNAVGMAPGDAAAALSNNAVKAAVLLEPTVTNIVAAQVGVVMMREDEFDPDNQLGVLIYPKSFRLTGDLPGRFTHGYLQGVRFYNDAYTRGDQVKRQRVIEILTSYTSVKNPALYDKMVMPGLHPDGLVNKASMVEDRDFWTARGYIKKPINIDELVDPSFAAAVVRKLGLYP